MIKAALFDMDGTLYDTERISMEGWNYACAKYGFQMTFEQICATHGHNAADNGRRFASWFGEDAPYWEIRDLRYEYMTAYLREHPVPVKPGVFELFQVLHSKNIRITIATGTARKTAASYWESTGVLPYIDASVCGDDITRSKPDPEIFLKAASLSEAAPSECIVFEDSRDGIFGARAAGCMACFVPDLEPASDEIREAADYVLPSLIEAAEMIREWPAVKR